MLTDKRAGMMAEAAISIPAVLMILVFGVSVSRAGYAAMAARNAANYGARIGAVSGSNPERYAKAAAEASLKQSGAAGVFITDVQVTGEGPGGVVSVTVTWRTETILAGVCQFFGEGCPAAFEGEARAVWRREGYLP
ncbi:MAG: pilus assembly protein [Anaerolineales bacterium]|nr:pilus assembly protein [Anaerolineales bacterium]